MKVFVDQDLCISCAVCIDIAPDVFHEDDQGITEAIEGEIPEDQVELVQEAMDSCPTEAIQEK